jgi:fatty-acyl-CoA synthase
MIKEVLQTMPEITSWLTEPVPGRGVHLANDGGGWDFVSYPDLAAQARRTGAELVAAGVRPGDVVCLLMPTGFPYFAAFFGVWVAGATPCPVVPPAFQAHADYVEHVATVLRQAEPSLVVTSPEYVSLVSRAMERAGRDDEPWLHRLGETEIEPREPGELGLLQFTSGSTGDPRGARASWGNLAANLGMIYDFVDWRDGDGTASWLPLHHDMGLIGCMICTVSAQGNLWLMQPEQFIRRPAQWLGCFAPGMASHTASPAFGFSYAARRVSAEQMAGLDLSNWRTAMVGAETIDPAALARFAQHAAPAGFRGDVYVPSYGLAEATLAVTVGTGPAARRLVRVETGSLNFGDPVRILDAAPLDERPRSSHEGWLIGHGTPAAGHGVTVRVLGEDGVELPDGSLGEITVTGPNVTDGYHSGREGGSTRFVDGALHTGDAGFLHDGDLYVLGRMGDALKLNGRSVYVEDLDVKVAAACGLDRSRLAVVSVYGAAGGGVALFAEAPADGEWAGRARAALRGELGPDCPVTVIAGTRGLVKRTSSGKPRRSHLWRLFQAGRLERAVVVPEPEPELEPIASPV